MRKLEIQSLGEVFNGKTPSRAEQRKDGYPILKIRDIDEVGQFRGTFESFVDQVFYEKYSKKKLRTGDTIILNAAHNADYVGSKNAFVTSELDGVIATGEWLIVRIKEANPQYINQYLKSPSGRQSLKNYVKGIHLYPKDVARISVPLPSHDDQIRIAYLLGKLEKLIAQRKQNLQNLDDLLKGIFLATFGDTVRNEKKWNIQSCDKAVLNISSGTSYGGEDRPFESTEEVGVLKISAVTKGTFDPTEFKVVNQARIKKSLRFVRRGDFLFSRANTIELVAACCIVMQDYERLFLPDKLWVLTLNEQLVNSQFFNHLLKNERYRNMVRNLANGGHDSMLNISMKKFMTIDVPCPPIKLQNKFALIVEKIEGIKTHYQKSLTDLHSLYSTLSQKAFKGELDLSRVLLPKLIEKKITSTKTSSDQKEISRSTEKAIRELNTFNQSHSSILKAIQSASAITRFDSPVIQAMRDLAEQASLWRTPLDELKNMAAIARATDALAMSANISNLTMEAKSFSKAAKLAQNIANSLPKIDMDWLRDQRSIIEDAMKPFSQMRDTMATLTWPENVSRSIMESASVMEQMRTVLPTDINLMRLPPTSSISISDIEEVEEPMYIFTRYDILETLKQEVAPLSFEDLLTKLSSLGDITFEGYERIKKLIFELISKGEMLQSYNDEKNNVQLTVTA